jgi:homoserine dehydrogenase
MPSAGSIDAPERVDVPVATISTPTRIALFGLGRVGSALARLAAASGHSGPPIQISGALVRTSAGRDRPRSVPTTTDAQSLLDARPEAVVEVLGGLEPARSLVLETLRRGIPIVTANKSLLAAHGEELFETAARSGAPLRYEACVIAGVPFLGTFEQRPFAATVTRVVGILNGTSHFIVSRLEEGAAYTDALSEVQRLGFAEPDASNDVNGTDAAEKLAILFRLFGKLRVAASDIDTAGIEGLTTLDIAQAKIFGGTIKPLAFADWSDPKRTSAFVGPALLQTGHPLGSFGGVTNGICLRRSAGGSLFYSGPGTGPDVTAATLLDDVLEAISSRTPRRVWEPARAVSVRFPGALSWFVRLQSNTRLPEATDVADLLASHGIWSCRVSSTVTRDGLEWRWFRTYPCPADRLSAALAALSAATSCEAWRVPTLEVADAD